MKSERSHEDNYFYFDTIDYSHKEGELLFDQHYHNYYEIYYIEKGDCNYFIDDKSYSLITGDLVLIPKGVIHNTLYTKNKPYRLLIHCSGKYIPFSALALFSKNNYLYRNSDITKTISDLLYKIKDEFTSPDTFSDDAILCYVRILFLTLMRNENKYKTGETKSSYIEKAIYYIQKNFTCDISLSEIANIFSISPEHFSRRFKKETGIGFNEYINLLRLKKAEELLKSEKFSVSDIATACGFNDSNYFSTKFKKKYGLSPTELQTISHAR